MTKKVLIVDDSALMRRVMSDIIVEDEQLTVADTAKNADMDVIMVGWGFRDEDFIKSQGAEFVIENPLDLLPFFK